MKGQSKLLVILSVILIAMIVGLILLGARDVNVSINSDFVSFDGMYGKKLYFKDITEISMKDTIPRYDRKIVGSYNNKTMKGKFVLQGLGESTLFIKDRKAPVIYIISENDRVIINYKDAAKTKELYDILMSNWKK